MHSIQHCQTQAGETALLQKQQYLNQGKRTKVGSDGDCQHVHLDVALATFLHVPLAKGKSCGQALSGQRSLYPTESAAWRCCWSHLPQPGCLARCHSLSVCLRNRKPQWKAEVLAGPPGAPADSKSIRSAQPGVEHNLRISETLSTDRCYRLSQAQPGPGSPPSHSERRDPLNINQGANG